MRATVLLLMALAMRATVVEAPAQAAEARATTCRISSTAAAWTQSALNDWAMLSTEVLHDRSRQLPTIIVFDDRCSRLLTQDSGAIVAATLVPSTLQYMGEPIAVWARTHRGTITLPSGESVPARPIATAVASSKSRPPFVVLALPSVFRRDSALASNPRFDLLLRGVLSHELLHTTQLPALVQQIDALARAHQLPVDLDDDILQRQFASDSLFRNAVTRERQLLFSAAFDLDANRARTSAREAIKHLRARRALRYVDSLTYFARMEDLFLTMEGSAEWVRFQMHRHRRDFASDAQLLSFLRGKEGYWSQDEGLALFLVLDRFMPDWKSELLTPAMPSPVDALERALRNLRVLPTSISDDSLLAVMGSFTRALGVRCVHCHVARNGTRPTAEEFALDEKPAKAIARGMLLMVREINDRHLSSWAFSVPARYRVTCATCHRGILRPRPIYIVLTDAYEAHGLRETERLYRSLRAEHFGSDAYDFGDVPLPTLAERIATNPTRLADGLSLMRLNLEFHPSSWFTWQQMGQLHLSAGDTVAAREAFMRGLAINPSRTFLRELLQSIAPPPPRRP